MRNYLLIIYIFLSLVFLAETGFSIENTENKMSVDISSKTIIEDSVKVDLLIQKGTITRISQPDSAIFFLNQAIQISKKANLQSQLVSSYRIKGVVYLLNSKFDSAILVYNEAITLAKKYSLNSILVKVYVNLGILYTKTGDYDKAFEYYSIVINEFGASLDKTEVANLYNNMGLMYIAKGDYIKAMDNHQKAYQIREQLNDTLSLASSMMNIANIYFYQEDFVNAISYYEKAAEVFIKNNISYSTGQCYHNIGTIYEKIDSLSKAEYYLKEAMKYESAVVSSGRAKTLNMLGLVNLKQNKFDEAEDEFMEALNIHRKINSHTLIIPVLNNLATLYNKRNMPDKAIKYTQQSLALSVASGSKEYEKDALYNFYISFEQKGDFKKSLEYYKEYSVLKDSLFGKEKHKQIKELEIKYETAKKENEIDLQRAKLAQNELEDKKKDAIIKKEQIQKYGILIIAFLLIIIFIIYFLHQKQKRNSTLQLLAKNEELNNQKISELIKKHQLDSVKSRLDAEENERHRIAKELHDGVGGSLAAIKLYVDSLRKSIGVDGLDLVHDNINKTYEQVRALSHNLTPPEFQFSSINDIVRDYVEHISKHSKTEIILNSNVKSDWSLLDESLQIGIYRIAQELINNVIKHAHASRVEFVLNLEEDEVYISVKDNGVGFDVSEKGSGIGIRNIKARVEDLNGEISINSEVGKGTEVSLSFPAK